MDGAALISYGGKREGSSPHYPSCFSSSRRLSARGVVGPPGQFDRSLELWNSEHTKILVGLDPPEHIAQHGSLLGRCSLLPSVYYRLGKDEVFLHAPGAHHSGLRGDPSLFL